MRRVVSSCAAVLLLTAAAAPAVAAGDSRADSREECWTHSVTVPEETSNAWTYVHTVNWCGDGSSVTSITVDGRFVKRSKDCKPEGDPVIEHGPENNGENTFSMGTLLCETEQAGPQQVCPWVIVTVYGDGSHEEATKGIERRWAATG
jgi:hypothetical protein